MTLFLAVGAVLLVLILGERTSHTLMRARDDLEATVDERTAELQENQKQLEAAVERSGLILDSAGEGIFGVDLEGNVAFINPATTPAGPWGMPLMTSFVAAAAALAIYLMKCGVETPSKEITARNTVSEMQIHLVHGPSYVTVNTLSGSIYIRRQQ